MHELVLRAYAKRCRLLKRTPTPSQFEPLPDIVRDLLSHTPRPNTWEEAQRIAEPIVDLLLDYTRLVTVQDGPFHIAVSNYFTPKLIHDAFFRFFEPQLDGMYASLKYQLDDNSKFKGIHIPPSFQEKWSDEMYSQYLANTPLHRLYRARVGMSLKHLAREHWCMFANSGAGKSSFIGENVLDFRDTFAQVVLDPHGKLIDHLSNTSWKVNPIVIEPKFKPACNMFYTQHATQNYAYVFSSQGLPLTTHQKNAFRNVMKVLYIKAQHEHTDLFDIQQMANEKKPDKYAKWIAKADAKTQEYFKHNFYGNRETSGGVVQRLEAIDDDPLLWELFSTPGYSLDFWQWLHEEKRTVLVTSRGLSEGEGTFMRYIVMLCIALGNKRKALGLTEEQCHPIQLWVDEAQLVLEGKEQIKKITSELRKFGVFLRAATQEMSFIDASDTLVSQSNVRIGANLSHKEATSLASNMNCKAELLQRATPKTHFEYKFFASGETPEPLILELPKGPWARWPKGSIEPTDLTARGKPATPEAPEPDEDIHIEPLED